MRPDRVRGPSRDVRRPISRTPSLPRTLRGPVPLVLLILLFLTGCATLRGVFALRQVDFSLDRVSDVRLAGVDVEGIRRYEELRAVEIARVAQAVSAGRMPLTFVLHLGADNPEGNPEARLLALDWTFYLQDRETVSGALPQAVVIPAAGSAEVLLDVRLDLLEFFDGGARDLVSLALALAGEEGPPAHVRVVATPTVETPIGPIRYPRPVTISREVGGRDP